MFDKLDDFPGTCEVWWIDTTQPFCISEVGVTAQKLNIRLIMDYVETCVHGFSRIIKSPFEEARNRCKFHVYFEIKWGPFCASPLCLWSPMYIWYWEDYNSVQISIYLCDDKLLSLRNKIRRKLCINWTTLDPLIFVMIYA